MDACGSLVKSHDLNNLPLYLDWSKGALAGKTPSTYVSDADVIRTWNSYEPNRTSIEVLFARLRNADIRPTTQIYTFSREVEIAQYLKQLRVF